MPAQFKRSLYALCFVLSSVPAAGAETLAITVAGIEPVQGRVYVGLHRAPGTDEAFPSPQTMIAGSWRLAHGPDVRFVFSDLVAGRYAVAVFHDANGNEQLDADLLGIPSEPTGFSNDARGFVGPPSFDKAALQVNAERLETTVTVE